MLRGQHAFTFPGSLTQARGVRPRHLIQHYILHTRVILSPEYVAISHVWGNAEWRNVEGVKGRVLAFECMAEFIVQSFLHLLGGRYISMDILCV
jgi:hypothetical protein